MPPSLFITLQGLRYSSSLIPGASTHRGTHSGGAGAHSPRTLGSVGRGAVRGGGLPSPKGSEAAEWWGGMPPQRPDQCGVLGPQAGITRPCQGKATFPTIIGMRHDP